MLSTTFKYKAHSKPIKIPRSGSNTNFNIKPSTNDSDTINLLRNNQPQSTLPDISLSNLNSQKSSKRVEINRSASKRKPLFARVIAKKSLNIKQSNSTANLHHNQNYDQPLSRKLGSSKSQSKYEKAHPPTSRDFLAGIDNIVNTIDNDYVQTYIDSAFEPQLPKPKLSKEDKKKLKKKIRIRYISLFNKRQYA